MSKFISDEKKVIKSLEKILDDKKKYVDFNNIQVIREAINELTLSDTFLVRTMIYEAGNLMAENLQSAKGWIEGTLKS